MMVIGLHLTIVFFHFCFFSFTISLDALDFHLDVWIEDVLYFVSLLLRQLVTTDDLKGKKNQYYRVSLPPNGNFVQHTPTAASISSALRQYMHHVTYAHVLRYVNSCIIQAQSTFSSADSCDCR